MFRFASPFYLLLLLLIPLLLLRRREQVASLRYATLSQARVIGKSWRVRLKWLPSLFYWLALAFLVVALARPQTGNTQQIVNGEGVDIALALDISSSMETGDFFPRSRLEAAKLVIEQFIEERPFDRLGLVVFANDAFVQAPPTTDHDVLVRLLSQVGSARQIRVPDGTAIGMGMATAVNMLRESDAESRVVILLTDGINNAGQIAPLTAAEAAKALDIKVYTIGAGKLNEFFGDNQNALDEETLQEIADITEGLYFRAEDTDGLERIYAEINALERSEFEIRSFTRYTEWASLLLWPGFILLLLAFLLQQTVWRSMP